MYSPSSAIAPSTTFHAFSEHNSLSTGFDKSSIVLADSAAYVFIVSGQQRCQFLPKQQRYYINTAQAILLDQPQAIFNIEVLRNVQRLIQQQTHVHFVIADVSVAARTLLAKLAQLAKQSGVQQSRHCLA